QRSLCLGDDPRLDRAVGHAASQPRSATVGLVARWGRAVEPGVGTGALALKIVRSFELVPQEGGQAKMECGRQLAGALERWSSFRALVIADERGGETAAYAQLCARQVLR